MESSRCLFDLPEADLLQVIKEAREDLQQLQGRRIFITGGTGFFGKWLLASLVYAEVQMGLNLQLTILSRDPASFVTRFPETGKQAVLRFLRGDVSTWTGNDERYDFVLHAATDTVAIAGEAQEEIRGRAIVEGTSRMLALASASGARRLLNISSGAVYGSSAGQMGGAKEEDYETAIPLTSYARAKREAERLCGESGFDFVTARAFAFLGPYLPLDAHYAAGNFLRDAQRGGPIFVRGDGTALRSYLHPVDLVIWLLRLLVRGKKARAYNVGSDEAISTAELARRIAAAAPTPVEVVIQSQQAHGSQNRYHPNIARARSELNVDVSIGLNEAIGRTLAFLNHRRALNLDGGFRRGS
jgi:nucleoside-diphosphate-sugar epimerase